MQSIGEILTQKNSSQVEVKAKTVYTTKEVLEIGIPSRNPLPDPKECDFCGKTLYHEGLLFNGSIIVWHQSPQKCSCEKSIKYWKKYNAEQKQKKREKDIAEKRKQMNARIQQLIGKSGIKKRFISRTFENFKVNDKNKLAFETAKKYAETFALYQSEGKGIYFEGTYGTGKTHLAVAIALKLLGQGIPVIYKTSIELLADIKRSYDASSGYDEYQVMDIYKKAELLIIDDLGKEQCTEWSMPILYAIMNDRYEEMCPTIITTNYNEETLKKRLTPKYGDSSNIGAIISRLHECNDVVTMAWNDYRGDEHMKSP